MPTISMVQREDDIPSDVPPELREELEAERPVESDAASYRPGSKVDCPDCGKTISVTKNGKLRSHKCDPTNVSIVKTARSGTRRASRKACPPNVRKYGVIGIAWVAEQGAVSYVSGVTGAPKDQIPDRVTALPNPDAMCGPLVELVWPLIPAPVARQIARFAEHDALIETALLWWVYVQGLQSFAREYAKLNPARPVKSEAQANVAVAASIDGVFPGSGGASYSGTVPGGLSAGRDR